MLDGEGQRNHAVVVIPVWRGIPDSGAGVFVFEKLKFGPDWAVREPDFPILNSCRQPLHDALFRRRRKVETCEDVAAALLKPLDDGVAHAGRIDQRRRAADEV
jgi:hypothetical protein